MFSEHLKRIEEGARSVYSTDNLAPWIAKHTKLDGKPFTFQHHEYQKDIISDPAKTLYVNKAAQTGLSEIFARWALACCTTQDNFTIIWTFPSTSDAERFTKARLDPIVASSPELRRAVSKLVNSSELKQFGANSFAYIRGTLSETGALSVPADLLLHDEFDRSDVDNIAAYVSRLQHKPTKMRRLFSTPTVANYGIDLACQTAKRKRQVWTCSCCNYTWLPSYENDVKIPGWDRPKREITKLTIKDVRWSEAHLLCPKCGREPSQELRYRSWVIENPAENYDAMAYFVSPFCAPHYLTAPYLVKVSADFGKWSEFCNQALGLTSEEEQETLMESDIRAALVDYSLDSSETHCLGVDLGLTCHMSVGRLALDGTLLVVHREKVDYRKLLERRTELTRLYRITTSVYDYQPYTDLVATITGFDPNAYGARYEARATTETHRIQEQAPVAEEGKVNFRMAIINRDIAFDDLMGWFKTRRVMVKQNKDADEYVAHLRDMKRIQVKDKFGELRYAWVKTQGTDHWHHSLLYLKTAVELRATIASRQHAGVPLVTGFKPKPREAPSVLGLRA
jgi:hypothetical protein